VCVCVCVYACVCVMPVSEIHMRFFFRVQLAAEFYKRTENEEHRITVITPPLADFADGGETDAEMAAKIFEWWKQFQKVKQPPNVRWQVCDHSE